jgi:transcriptional regulator with XRE-family HTH domain
MTEAPSDVFARRLKRYRERRGWTQADLARELRNVGWTVDRAQVAKIETGTRNISLDEALSIAWALGLPPALLYLPLGESADVAIAPDVIVHPDLARKWIAGSAPAAHSNQRARLLSDWHDDMGVWWVHDRLNEAQKAVRDAEEGIRGAEYVEDPEQVKEARLNHVRALKGFAEVLEEMRSAGLSPPEIHQAIVESMRKVGIDYDGPVYPGPGAED